MTAIKNKKNQSYSNIYLYDIMFQYHNSNAIKNNWILIVIFQDRVYNLLETWKMRNSKEATVGALVECLEELKLKSVAGDNHQYYFFTE